MKKTKNKVTKNFMEGALFGALYAVVFVVMIVAIEYYLWTRPLIE